MLLEFAHVPDSVCFLCLLHFAIEEELGEKVDALSGTLAACQLM